MRLGQKCSTPRNKKKLTKIAVQIFVDFGLFKKELLLLPRSLAPRNKPDGPKIAFPIFGIVRLVFESAVFLRNVYSELRFEYESCLALFTQITF